MEFFLFNLITSLWQVGALSLSRTIQCGTLGPYKSQFFLFGRQLGLEYWLKTNLEGGVGGCQTNTTCVR